MISYEPLWATMEKKNITKYQLIYHWGLSSNTLRRMSHNEAISTTTLNELCLILDCGVEDIIRFHATTEEALSLEKSRQEINNRKAPHKGLTNKS